jgi:hypothetical protein
MAKRMQCKDIPDRPILEFIASLGEPAILLDRDGDVPYEHSVVRAMPDGTPPNLVRAKMAMLLRRDLVDGCVCGCRGDFELTRRGRAFLMPDYPDEITPRILDAIKALVHTSQPVDQVLTTIGKPGW